MLNFYGESKIFKRACGLCVNLRTDVKHDQNTVKIGTEPPNNHVFVVNLLHFRLLENIGIQFYHGQLTTASLKFIVTGRVSLSLLACL